MSELFKFFWQRTRGRVQLSQQSLPQVLSPCLPCRRRLPQQAVCTWSSAGRSISYAICLTRNWDATPRVTATPTLPVGLQVTGCLSRLDEHRVMLMNGDTFGVHPQVTRCCGETCRGTLSSSTMTVTRTVSPRLLATRAGRVPHGGDLPSKVLVRAGHRRWETLSSLQMIIECR